MAKPTGFTLVEVAIAIFIIALAGTALLRLAVAATQVAVDGQLETVALNLARARVESVRGLLYSQVGTTNGPIAGVLPPAETVGLNNFTYSITYDVRYVDDPRTAATTDFKKVRIAVSWTPSNADQHTVSLVTYVASLSAS